MGKGMREGVGRAESRVVGGRGKQRGERRLGNWGACVSICVFFFVCVHAGVSWRGREAGAQEKSTETDEEKGDQLVFEPLTLKDRGEESELTVDSSLESHVGHGETIKDKRADDCKCSVFYRQQ